MAVAVAAAVLAPFAVAAEEVTGARSLLVGGMPGAEAGPGGEFGGGGSLAVSAHSVRWASETA